MTPPNPKAFLARVNSKCVRDHKTGCLEWQGCLVGSTPQIRWRYRGLQVARAVYEIAHGDAGSCSVHRLCGNNRCVELSHLAALTPCEWEERKPEVVRERRRRAAERAGRSLRKLSPEQVTAIREAAARGEVLAPFVREYGVNAATVYNLANGFTYRDGKESPERGAAGFYRRQKREVAQAAAAETRKAKTEKR